MLLLAVLKHLQSFYPQHFELGAITIELGFEGMDFAPVEAFCREEQEKPLPSNTESRRLQVNFLTAG